MLTDGKTRNSIGGWSNNGKFFAFSSNKENGVDMNVFINDLEGNEKQLFSKKGSWSFLDWSPDDKKVIVRRYISINESYVHVVDINNNKMTRFNDSEEKISYGNVLYSKDGKGMYYTSDEGTEFRHLRYYDIRSDKHTILTKHIDWDVRGFT